MKVKNGKNNNKDGKSEDSTPHRRFMTSFDQWMALDRQRRKVARHLEEVTEEIMVQPGDEKK